MCDAVIRKCDVGRYSVRCYDVRSRYDIERDKVRCEIDIRGRTVRGTMRCDVRCRDRTSRTSLRGLGRSLRTIYEGWKLLFFETGVCTGFFSTKYSKMNKNK